jgi:hypothetical protein
MVWIGWSFLAAQAKQKNLSPLPNSKTLNPKLLLGKEPTKVTKLSKGLGLCCTLRNGENVDKASAFGT